MGYDSTESIGVDADSSGAEALFRVLGLDSRIARFSGDGAGCALS